VLLAPSCEQPRVRFPSSSVTLVLRYSIIPYSVTPSPVAPLLGDPQHGVQLDPVRLHPVVQLVLGVQVAHGVGEAGLHVQPVQLHAARVAQTREHVVADPGQHVSGLRLDEVLVRFGRAVDLQHAGHGTRGKRHRIGRLAR
jgi:hypothetical protein